MNISAIYNWMSSDPQYKNGVTGKQVIEHFGIGFQKAWNSLKRKKNHVYYENGKWFSWDKKRI